MVMMQKKAPWLLLLSSFSNNATNDVFTFQDMIPGRKFSPLAVARQEATCARAFGSLTTLEMEPRFFVVLTLTVMIIFLTNNLTVYLVEDIFGSGNSSEVIGLRNS